MRLVASVTVVIALVGATASAAEVRSHGFDPESFTAVSASDYWVLGSVPCRIGSCAAILRTTDGGKSFVRIPAPSIQIEGPTWTTLRFADRRDGFAFVGNGEGLYATHDGGTTWHRLALGTVLAFATGGGYAYTVSARCSLKGCTGDRLERSPVEADAWTARPLPFADDGDGGFDLAADGSSVWLLGTAAGSRRRWDVLARSTDEGRTFTVGQGPCVPGLGGDLEPTSASVVWAVCPTGMMAQAWRSTDGGVTFRHLNTPGLVNSAVLAPASAHAAVLARNGAGFRLLRTTNTGATWTRPHTPGNPSYIGWIEFTDARVGTAIADGALWRTTDGGADWTRVRLG